MGRPKSKTTIIQEKQKAKELKEQKEQKKREEAGLAPGEPLPIKRNKDGKPLNGVFFTSETGREAGRKGGHASAKAQRERKEMKETFQALMEMNIKKGNPEDFQNLAEATGKNISVQQSIALSMVKKAQKGDVKAAAFIRDTMGEMPTAKVEVDNNINTGFNILEDIYNQLTQAQATEDKQESPQEKE